MPRKVLNQTVKGAAVGGAVGGAVGFINSAMENNAQMAADRRSRKFQDEQAKKQFDRQKYFDSLEKNWNSEQAQLQRMRDAGLNPNLVYGQLSSSTVSTPTPPLASTPNGSVRDFDVSSSAASGSAAGIDTLYKKAVIDNTNQNTASQFQDTQSKAIENRYKETNITNSIVEQLERINKLRADIAKTGADTATVDALRDSLLEQLQSEISLNNQKINESKQNIKESESKIAVNKQNIKESDSRINLNEQNIKESESRILTQETERDLNRAIEQLRKIEIKDLLLKYHMTNDQYQMINEYVHDHDLPPGSEKAIIEALENFAQSSGQNLPKITLETIGSWLNGKTWLDFLSSNNRTDAIREGNNQSEDGTFTPPPRRHQPSDSTYNDDDFLQRNSKDYEKEFDRVYTPSEKRHIVQARVKWKYLNQQSKQEYYKWIENMPYSTQLERAKQVHHLYYKQTGFNALPNQD